MTDPTYTVSSNIVSAGVLPAADVLHVSIDRRLADLFNPLDVGVAEVLLDNFSGDYSPETNPNVRPNRFVLVGATTDAGSEYQLFSGRVASIGTNPELGRRNVLLRCVDHADRLRRTISVPFRVDTITTSLVIDVLTAAGFTSSEYAIGETILDEIPFAWLDDISGGDALNQITRAGAHHIWMGGDGVLNLKGRQHHAASTSVASYVNAFLRLNYELNLDEVVNDARISAQPRRVASSVGTVAWLEKPVRIFAGSAASFFLEYVDPDTLERPTPVNSMATPVASQDYRFTSQESGGTDLTSQFAVELETFATRALVTATNSGASPGFLSRFQLRGFAVQRQPEFSSIVEVSSSQAAYGHRTHEIRSDLIESNLFAQNYAEWLAATRHDLRARISIALKNEFPDVLVRNVHDIISVVEDHTGINAQFRVAEVHHEINATSGLEHTLVMGLQVEPPTEFLILDADPEGRLDERRLGF